MYEINHCSRSVWLLCIIKDKLSLIYRNISSPNGPAFELVGGFGE
jgi:hypothetical protein